MPLAGPAWRARLLLATEIRPAHGVVGVSRHGDALFPPAHASFTILATADFPSEREQAKEGQYIRDMEAQKLRQLKEKADAANKELEAQKKHMEANGDKSH